MKIYNQDKTQILESVDLELGYIQRDTILVTEEQQEEFHYEEKHYDNGGVAKYRVIDKQYIPAEYEDIQVYILYTQKELNQNKLNKLTNWFNTTYRYKYEKYTRLIALNKLDDDGIEPNKKLLALYEEAEDVRRQIQKLEEA
jgi:hypothetical protein